MSIKPGVKIGLKDWQTRLTDSQAQYCEVWFNANRAADYQEMFTYLKTHHIESGLHFWGSVGEGSLTNIGYPDPSLLPQTIALIKSTIDQAAKYNFRYVNIHAGSQQMHLINFERQYMELDPKFPQISLSLSEETQALTIAHLNDYAKEQGVLLLTETVTQKDPKKWYEPDARLHATRTYNLPVNTLIKLSAQGYLITNDFVHTFCDEYDQPLAKLTDSFWKKTLALVPTTKLLHINTIIPPYNGTDSHNGITDADFGIAGIFPTRKQFIQLLSLFKDRSDVWAINEPTDDHVENYHALKKLLSEI